MWTASELETEIDDLTSQINDTVYQSLQSRDFSQLEDEISDLVTQVDNCTGRISELDDENEDERIDGGARIMVERVRLVTPFGPEIIVNDGDNLQGYEIDVPIVWENDSIPDHLKAGTNGWELSSYGSKCEVGDSLMEELDGMVAAITRHLHDAYRLGLEDGREGKHLFTKGTGSVESLS